MDLERETHIAHIWQMWFKSAMYVAIGIAVLMVASKYAG